MNLIPNKSMTKQERDKQICTLYEQNYRIGEIAKKLSIERHTVTRALIRHGIYDKEKQKNRLNKDTIQRNEKIIELYQKGLSFRKIAKELDIGHSTAEYVIHTFIDKDPIQYDLEIIPSKEIIRHRKYDFDIDFFEKIDTEEKAYWLGFLYADGCVTDTEVKMELQTRDANHVEKFKNSVKAFSKELRYRNDNIKSCLIYLNSIKMVSDLINLGCCPKKTYVLTFPTKEQVPEKLINHFMRGYFDGDGCIYKRKRKTGVNTFSLVGTEDFLMEYKNVLFKNINKKTDVKLLKTVAVDKIKSLMLGGNEQIKLIYNFLYDNATIYMDRKKDKFEEIIK